GVGSRTGSARRRSGRSKSDRTWSARLGSSPTRSARSGGDPGKGDPIRSDPSKIARPGGASGGAGEDPQPEGGGDDDHPHHRQRPRAPVGAPQEALSGREGPEEEPDRGHQPDLVAEEERGDPVEVRAAGGDQGDAVVEPGEHEVSTEEDREQNSHGNLPIRPA